MTKDEAVAVMIEEVEQIERDRIAMNFHIDANQKKKETVDLIIKTLRELKINDENKED